MGRDRSHHRLSPKVSYIVSAFDRPTSLPCCLWSLKVQSDPSFEVIVADNALREGLQLRHALAVRQLDDPRFRHVDTSNPANCSWDCYWSAEWLVTHGRVKGEWICCPSDDSYYVPIFQEALLDAAGKNGWDLVYSDMLYDRRIGGVYKKLDVEPRRNWIDKTGFFVKRKHWIGFPEKPTTGPQRSSCDGAMIDQLVASGIKHGKVPEILVVHN